jgi:hypothetical protein
MYVCVVHSLPESSIAPYLTELQKRVKEEGIRVGSYPLLQGRQNCACENDRTMCARTTEPCVQGRREDDERPHRPVPHLGEGMAW